MLPFLVGIEALVIATYFLLPAPVTEVPFSILNILQLTLIIGGALITYKLFQFETPTEQTLLQNIIKSYKKLKTMILVSLVLQKQEKYLEEH